MLAVENVICQASGVGHSRYIVVGPIGSYPNLHPVRYTIKDGVIRMKSSVLDKTKKKKIIALAFTVTDIARSVEAHSLSGILCWQGIA